MDAYSILFFYVFILGLIAGSFSNVCIHRLPKKESIVFPRSHCRNCSYHIRWYDNIPLLSWLILGGKCRDCSSPISVAYPAIELVSGIIYLTLFYQWGTTKDFILYSLLCSSFLVVAVIDFKHKIIPDVITIPGIIIGLMSSIFLQNITFSDSITGLLVGGGLFFLIAIITKGGMGGGDIKFIAMIGAFLGWRSVLFTTFVGSAFGSVLSILLMFFGKKSRKDHVPFGPFLVVGASIYLFYGEEIIGWYFNTMRR